MKSLLATLIAVTFLGSPLFSDVNFRNPSKVATAELTIGVHEHYNASAIGGPATCPSNSGTYDHSYTVRVKPGETYARGNFSTESYSVNMSYVSYSWVTLVEPPKFLGVTVYPQYEDGVYDHEAVEYNYYFHAAVAGSDKVLGWYYAGSLKHYPNAMESVRDALESINTSAHPYTVERVAWPYGVGDKIPLPAAWPPSH